MYIKIYGVFFIIVLNWFIAIFSSCYEKHLFYNKIWLYYFLIICICSIFVTITTAAQSSNQTFCYFIPYAPNCITIHNFFYQPLFLFPPYSVGKKCPRKTRYRSNNLTAKHYEKIAHIQLSRKGNEITWGLS